MKPSIVIFFNDWKIYPNGVNAGGGESSTLALAKAFARKNFRVIACANLPDGDRKIEGIDFYNFGSDYRIIELSERLRDIGPFHCFCATLVHPLIAVRNLPNCLSKTVIVHAPSLLSSGLEPVTVMEMIDNMVCVSEAQRSLMLGRGTDANKVVVVKNGFDPILFPYADSTNRDFRKLIFIGRVEQAKGIDILVQVFAGLINTFKDLTLDVYGDESYWPEFTAQKDNITASLPGLKFHGKTSQAELSQQLRKSGILVFPSVTFESAGLAIIEAQASGCPVVAFGVGGVKEYLQDDICGKVLLEKTPQALFETLSHLLANPDILKKMSDNCLEFAREQNWDKVADRLLEVAERSSL